MEWLNSVWKLLCTENQNLTKIIFAPTVVIEGWLGFQLIVSILKINYSRKREFLYIIFLSLISFINEFFIQSPFNILFNYIANFIFIKLLFKEKIIKTLLCMILPTAIFASVGILILKPMLIIFNLSISQAQFTPIYESIYIFLLYTTIYFVIKLIKKKDIILKLNDDFCPKDKKTILINFLLGFFSLCLQLFITAFYTNVLPMFITFLSFISLLAYFFISLYSLTKTMKLQITTRNLENAESYNNTLSFLYDNVKSFKHDFDNMVFTIGGFINTNDMPGLKKYYESLEKDCERVNNVALLNPQLINNAGIYNLLTAKYQKAIENNVEIQLDFFFDLDKLHMPIYDFSRMLGILIDNAIEAASNTTEKIVKLAFRDSYNSNTQTVKIENTFSNVYIDTNKIFEKGFTQKENHSGMGLWEVTQIIKKNNNIKLLTTTKANYFIQTLEIYY